MPQSVKMIVIIILGVAALWDGFTTAYGTAKIFGVNIVFTEERLVPKNEQSPAQGAKPTGERTFFILFASVLFGALMLGLIISSGLIFTGANTWLKGLNALAISYDLLTSFIGNQDLIYRGHVIGFAGWFVLLGFTLFASGSSLILALLSKQARIKIFSKLAI
ncbi:hypothetical protein U14_04295 [Candidatus Moduliflexus flocculans]|uniref:Uncharacterized protein n=1 Tax=Candidatus Moduliflexus flocculans TaxID=1499966 RepID=A0A0S6W3X3_9BACT|nr:hypothetical protein U14_04295 [Candidatus Moduliflexus flocculans]